ncbi:MAG: GspH/FimT family pseudopilin [Betaproteobacteria bacterium]|nr:GspH/FimT family pseudopilin [Betaproteobacteria bacterium]
MRRHTRARGFTLIELLITVAVLGIVLMLGLPNLSAWVQNTQIRNSAEAMVAGLQLARAEALRRNRPVRFNLVDTLDASCNVAANGRNWVVSMADPTSLCHEEASETVDPFILQKRSGEEGSQNAVVTAATAGVTFNGLGSALGAMQINISNPSGGACRTPAGSEPMRCLQVVVSASGSVRMCDPAVTEDGDPRKC